jgi:hypothetical protein
MPNAAQCPPMVVRANGEHLELDATGMPVGLMEGAEFTVESLRQAPGVHVVIYSDPVREHTPRRKKAGLQLHRCAAWPPGGIFGHGLAGRPAPGGWNSGAPGRQKQT